MKLDIAINYVNFAAGCFLCQYIEASLKLCKSFDLSVFALILLAVSFKRRTVDYG